MTANEARDYLKSIRIIERGIYAKLDQIDALQAMAESCTARSDKERIQSSGDYDKMAVIVGKIDDLTTEVMNMRDELNHRRKVVATTFNDIEDSRQRKFMFYHYIKGRGLYQVAADIDVSNSTIKRIRQKAVCNFATICSKPQYIVFFERNIKYKYNI